VCTKSLKTTVSKKKLYAARPEPASPATVETQRTKTRCRQEPCDPHSLERGVRQLLADKVSGTLLGTWLLVPEHLRLGTWDLLCGWSGQSSRRVEPRLALQLVHEAALCVNGVRLGRSLSQKGFEAANGLPFVTSDQAIHDLLNSHTVAQAHDLQAALGHIRRASGHFKGNLLAIDPHRMHSYSKRQTVRRKSKSESQAVKSAQTFFCFDVETLQPLAFTIGSSARTPTQATPELLQLTERILQPRGHSPLVLADTEHVSIDLFEHVLTKTPFDLMTPLPKRSSTDKQLAQLEPSSFTPRWAGFATTSRPFCFKHSRTPFHQVVQRCGERDDDYRFKAFLSTFPGNEVENLTVQYPKRWHVEEFFNAYQSLGWKRAGTLNLNIRYGRMTFALLAQASLHTLRKRLGDPYESWEASHFANRLLAGLDGDLRVSDDTIIVTFYNAPNSEHLQQHYKDLPAKLEREGVDPRIPWLYDYKLDFRFK